MGVCMYQNASQDFTSRGYTLVGTWPPQGAREARGFPVFEPYASCTLNVIAEHPLPVGNHPLCGPDSPGNHCILRGNTPFADPTDPGPWLRLTSGNDRQVTSK